MTVEDERQAALRVRWVFAWGGLAYRRAAARAAVAGDVATAGFLRLMAGDRFAAARACDEALRDAGA